LDISARKVRTGDDLVTEELRREFTAEEPIYVARPTFPPRRRYEALLATTWENRWLTNDGPHHRDLEQRLTSYLDIEHLSLFCNGTIALLVSLQALRITSGEVITTPFTFPATTHVLHWNHVRPVFCDVEPETLNLDSDLIESLITSKTRAILAVHVFGNPCAVEKIHGIAERHGLPVIYDASHAFAVKYQGKSLLSWGDLSTLSFHATKLFSTGEGGAIVAQSSTVKQRIDFLKNFGIADEETVIGPGINGKMNELQAAFGLATLPGVTDEIARRATVARIYREELDGAPGIRLLPELQNVTHNYSYFPILIDNEQVPFDRDLLHRALKELNIFTRKYFFPLCSSFPCYSSLPSADPAGLPVAEKVARQILCLPIYGTLEIAQARSIGRVVRILASSQGPASHGRKKGSVI